MTLTSEQARNIQNFILENGHSQPFFDGEYIVYRDQTMGMFSKWVKTKWQPILEIVDGLSIPKLEDLVNVMRFEQKKYNVVIIYDSGRISEEA
jgi:hypothetical protein